MPANTEIVKMDSFGTSVTDIAGKLRQMFAVLAALHSDGKNEHKNAMTSLWLLMKATAV